MTEKILITVPALLLQPGDHVYGYVVSQFKLREDGAYEFKFVVPFTVHSMNVIVLEKDLKDVSFPLTKRGDDHSPNTRNEILGLPPVPPKVYVAPEPIAIYPVGTELANVNHFDRSMKILFACPKHPESAWLSKDPFSSSIFPQSDSTVDCGPKCDVSIWKYVVTHEYKPTRNS